ncbi:MAG TPA: formate dehydrogenase accessory protein FdhE [Candidatus Limnocylindria bacterium]|nr:formate dehydrogenase accessory protein FdhE [Candidatus Limnocylindria bacterium]
MPTQLELDEARARWRELAGEDPGLGPIAAFHEARLASLAARPAPDAAVEISREDADRALRDGRPLLAAGRLAVDPVELQDELRRTCEELAATADEGSSALAAATVLARATVDVARLVVPALEDDRDVVAREANALGVDATALGELLQLAVQPALWEAAVQARAVVDLDRWDRGFCPLCGSWPALAELVGPERRRVLRCVRCGSGWSWLVLLCPYCGTDDHRELGSLAETDAGGRTRGIASVDTCERCRGYVKAVAAFTSYSAPRIVAEDVATLDLDVAAGEAGYRRPGDVDPAVAGIPRLVREGRALPG